MPQACLGGCDLNEMVMLGFHTFVNEIADFLKTVNRESDYNLLPLTMLPFKHTMYNVHSANTHACTM